MKEIKNPRVLSSTCFGIVKPVFITKIESESIKLNHVRQ